MQAKITKRSDSQVVISVSLDEQHLKQALKRTYDALRPKVKAAGFRAGKAPDHIVERELGANVVQAEVLEAAVANSYGQAVKDLEIAAIAAPKVTLGKFVPYTDLEYSAEIPVLPAVKLPDLHKIALKRPQAKIEDAQVDRVIEDLRRRLAKRTLANRPAQMGDEVILDFDGRQDGQPVTGASSKNYTLALGSGTFIPGFEEEVVGLKTGETKTFTIKFPDNYASRSLAGQQVEFTITIGQVYNIDLPVADDKLASEAGPFATLAQLREDIIKQLVAEKQAELDRQYENEVVEKILDSTKITVPTPLVEQQLETLRMEVANNLAYQGMDMDKYLEVSGKTKEQMDAEFRPQAEKRVAAAIVLTEIARDQGIQVSEDEIHAELDRIKAAYPDLASKSELEHHDLHNEVYNHLLSTRTMAKILEQVEQK